MKIKQLLASQKFTLEVTMPQSIEFVDAVLKGGAQALKMRVNNMDHDSKLHNGLVIGSFSERKDFLAEVVRHAGDVPVGLVPGLETAYVSEAERDEMEEIGIDYFNTDPSFVPGYMFESRKMNSVLAVTCENMSELLLRGIASDSKVDIVEGNMVPMKDKGSRFVYGDVLKYRGLVETIGKPVIATGQRVIRPDDVKYYYDVGCKAFMLGVVAFRAAQEAYDGGDIVTPETCYRLTSEFREAVEKL